MLDRGRRLAAAGAGLAVAVVAGAALLASDPRSDEVERLVDALGVGPGSAVADVGAGRGAYAVELARRVGDSGRVYATEVEDGKLREITERAERAQLSNVTTVLGDQQDTGLPSGCCDAILLRLVYHHFENPAPMRHSLARALRPGGRLVIVDTRPRPGWRELADVPERGGHGIEPEDLIRELAADGFEVVGRQDDWPDPDAQYCVVFRLASP